MSTHAHVTLPTREVLADLLVPIRQFADAPLLEINELIAFAIAEFGDRGTLNLPSLTLRITQRIPYAQRDRMDSITLLTLRWQEFLIRLYELYTRCKLWDVDGKSTYYHAGHKDLDIVLKPFGD